MSAAQMHTESQTHTFSSPLAPKSLIVVDERQNLRLSWGLLSENS